MESNQHPDNHPHEFHIQIDRNRYEVSLAKMTGAQLRKLPEPDIGPDRDLFQVIPGAPDRKIEDADVIEMRDGLRFFTAPARINPGYWAGTGGCVR